MAEPKDKENAPDVGSFERTLLWKEETYRGALVCYQTGPEQFEVGASMRQPDGSVPEPTGWVPAPRQVVEQLQAFVRDVTPRILSPLDLLAAPRLEPVPGEGEP